MPFIMGQLMGNPVDLIQLKFAYEIVSNLLLNASAAQLNVVLLPSQQAMQSLFE